ncbi:protein of unknown function [Microlunatus sagamiharensis]|uniref:Bacteriocin-protection, YdeI or OmpD-Associated n=1 Tax=Microlunatus sagamiharensis TaxID=546874 RepID=A0A1H2LQ77_9ACTN|nr:YdeI/OmpD-associated family protein [Microlunatus sagamiharensis]SDU83163.1 protein of unknown function [Microlunatus sagamiharensis]
MSEAIRFSATVELHGKSATGIEVPAEVVERLGAGRRPVVRTTLNQHTYATTLGVMGGRTLLPVSAEQRTAAGIAAGDEVEVALVADDAPRTVEVPDDLAAAVAAEPAAQATFDGSTPSQRKEWVRWVTEAKRDQTRTDRLARTVEALVAGRRTR